MNQPWNSGYVADIAYIEGFYVQQSPARMALACLFGNVAADLPEPDDDACYLELGCGCGIGALVTAASNPGWQVTAIDYNPAHISIRAGIAPPAPPPPHPPATTTSASLKPIWRSSRQAPRPTPFPRPTSSPCTACGRGS